MSIKTRKYLTLAIFFLFFCLGLFLSDDYGLSWDEPIQRNHGLVSAKYIVSIISPDALSNEKFEKIPALESYAHKNYGVIFHLPAVFVEIATGMTEPDLWHFRHAYTFLWFFIAVIFFYLLVSRRYGCGIALVACLFFILSPRIFAESFYNVKDLVFLSSFTVAMYFCISYLEKKSFGAALCLALSSAVASNIRIVGLLLPALVCLFFMFDYIRNRSFNKKALGGFIFFMALTPILTIALWPSAWAHPIRFLWETIVLSSNFPWNGKIIYLGKVVRGAALPWHYIPVWFTITTPLSYLVLFAMGLFVMMQNLNKTKGVLLKIETNKEDLFYLAIVVIPIVLVILLGSTLYDGWRHLYFIYPAFLLIVLNGLDWLTSSARSVTANNPAWKNAAARLLLGALVIYSIYIAYWMVRNHPYQYVYFNFLAGNDIENTFDRDYWGVAARVGMEYVTKMDQRQQIKVSGSRMVHLKNNMKLLEQSDRKRVRLVQPADAEYFIETYRNVRGSSTMETTGREIYSIIIDSFKIMSVFDLTGRRKN